MSNHILTEILRTSPYVSARIDEYTTVVEKVLSFTKKKKVP